MADRSWAGLVVPAFPGALLACERVTKLARGEEYEVRETWALDFEAFQDFAGHGANPEWQALGEALQEGDADALSFEPFTDPPSAFDGWGRLDLDWHEVGGGSYSLREEWELGELLRKLGLAYVISGGGYWSEWGSDFEAWKPGWEEPEGGPEDPNAGACLTLREYERRSDDQILRYFHAQELARDWRPWKLKPDTPCGGSAAHAEGYACDECQPEAFEAGA
jgi:hypothetical protein